MYILFREDQVDDTLEMGKHIFAGVDKDGNLLGIEVLFVSRQFAPEERRTVTVNIGKAVEPIGAG
ncbi:MAG: DUF2283 domain-containing protein [Anaerolineae bacterium]|nr:DUF2283 domain-containing protein [Anaerolineae bacterium]